MRAHCVRARFRDRSWPCFIARAWRHVTFIQLSGIRIVAERGRARPCSSGPWPWPGELLTALSRRGQCGSFRCKMVRTASVRKGAMTRRRANGHSFLPAKRGASSAERPFFWSLGIRGRNLWNEPCFQDWSTSTRNSSSFDVRKMLGCCGQIVRRWGRLSETNAFSRREESSLIHGVRRRVRLVAWLRKWCRVAVNDAAVRSLCGRIRISLARSAAFWTFWTFSASRWERHRWRSRSLIIDLLQTRATSVWQGIISGWIQWVKHACTCTSCTPHCRTGKEILWIWLWTASFGLGSQWGTLSNTNRPHGSGEEQDSKLSNSLTLALIFGIKACD